MLTQTNHKQTFRFVPSTSLPVDPKRVEEILKQEWELVHQRNRKERRREPPFIQGVAIRRYF
jgi:glutamate-1-semialdehyde 2,1-aminomutase